MPAQTSKVLVEDFVAHQKLALVGVSRNPGKFGNLAYRELKARGYHIFPINRNLNQIDGMPCYPSLENLPEKVDGLVIVVPPKETETIVQQADAAGITRIWMQQGSESDAAIDYCHKHDMREIHGECILMFAEPVKSYHRVHRCIQRFIGKLPR